MAKLRHIAISAEDPEAVAGWYREAFGLEEVGRSPVGVYLSDGDINFAVLRLPDDRDPTRIARGVHHFGFVVEDAEATYARLRALGAERQPDVALGGQYFEVKWTGPDGQCVGVGEHGWGGAKGLEPLAGTAAG